MSEEKKLTNEEIIKDIERSTGMPSYWKTIVLDLIHRLQAEIEHKKKCYDELCNRNNDMACEIAEQKAEIERLNKCVMSEEQVRKCCADIIQSTRQQAVKDTAKEILEMAKANLDEHWSSGVYTIYNAIRNSYGVEVM